jgi:hypothetical protein
MFLFDYKLEPKRTNSADKGTAAQPLRLLFLSLFVDVERLLQSDSLFLDA